MEAFNELEKILNEIEILKEDLSAEIIISSGKVQPDHRKRDFAESRLVSIYSKSKWFVAKKKAERVLNSINPGLYYSDYSENLSKKLISESTRYQWWRIYNCPGLWFSDRYMAAKDLDIDDKELEEQVNNWVKELDKKILATKTEKRKVLVFLTILPYKEGGSYEAYCLKGAYPQQSKKGEVREIGIEFVDIEKRLEAIREAGDLLRVSNSNVVRDLLQSIYYESHPFLYISGIDDITKKGKIIDKGYISKMRRAAQKRLRSVP